MASRRNFGKRQTQPDRQQLGEFLDRSGSGAYACPVAGVLCSTRNLPPIP